MPSLIAEANRVNDFVVKFANVNGTGSASANSLIMKAIFRMGVPVTGKNYFPSNIQGLPTWYEIRVTRDGYVARASHVDIMVAMNAETYSKDIRELRSGGYLIYDSTWPRSALLQRGDITVIAVPLAKLVNENFDGVRNRILLKNIAYAGAMIAALDVDFHDAIFQASHHERVCRAWAGLRSQVYLYLVQLGARDEEFTTGWQDRHARLLRVLRTRKTIAAVKAIGAHTTGIYELDDVDEPG